MNENQEIVYNYLSWELMSTSITPMSIIYYMIDNLDEIPNDVYVAYTQLSKEEELYVLYNICENYIHFAQRNEPNE